MSPPNRLASLLTGIDYFRRSPSRIGGRGEHKEWQHFIVHAGDIHLLVNLSLVDEARPDPSPPREVARLIVLAHGEGWDGDVERFGEDEVKVEAGRMNARFGRNTLSFDGGAYRLSVALRSRPVSAELELIPTALPALSAHHPLAPERHISWLFLPRLLARGTIALGGRTVRVRDAPAYHDHNWGHFRWADDFCWEWGSILPRGGDSPWSAVLVRMADRGRSVARYQALFVWYEDRPLRVFRDEELRFCPVGHFQPARSFTVPRPMALLVPGTAADLPQALEVHARGDDGDSLRLLFRPGQAARLVFPAEGSLEQVIIIHEVLGRTSLSGKVRGKAVDTEGTGVFEFVRS